MRFGLVQNLDADTAAATVTNHKAALEVPKHNRLVPVMRAIRHGAGVVHRETIVIVLVSNAGPTRLKQVGSAVQFPEDHRRGPAIFVSSKDGAAGMDPDFERGLGSARRLRRRWSAYFRSGPGTLQTTQSKWQARLKKVFKLAGIPDGHSHRFRDTFAVDLLSKGVSLETVPTLLGHTSIATTEKHYAPWVQARQMLWQRR